MYAWIFRHLPGPTWLKVIEALIIIGFIVYGLLEFGFPWIQENFDLVDNTVDTP
ncbi:MAG: hypothetical protein Q4P71_02240 [Actinomycetaceae bacterium]|nr:hypothetical protein [Actinomycetaceae bacterium]